MSRQTRRTFLKQAAAGAAALPFIPHAFAIAGTKGSGKILGANETIHVAVAGIRGRGGEHIAQFGRMKNVQITYLVDPDKRVFASRARRSPGSPATRRSASRTFARRWKTRIWTW